MNLRDKRNASLRELVLDGDISAEKFANMTAEVGGSKQTWQLYGFFVHSF